MKKTKLTRSLLAACSIVALTAVMYGCAHDGGSDDTMDTGMEMPEPTPYETAKAAIAAATTAAAAQAAYDAVKDDVTAAEGEKLQAAVDARIVAINTMARATMQMAALTTASGNVDTTGLTTQAAIDAAQMAIDALQAAIDAAADVDDTSMYETQVTTAQMAVNTAQGNLDTMGRMTAQRMAIMSAVTMARTAVNGVNDDSTDSEVASADSAVAALEDAIEDAVDLPEGDTTVASAQGTLTTLMAQLNTAKTSRQAVIDEADEKEAERMAATGRALRAALGPPATPVGNSGALANNEAVPTLVAAGLTINAASGAGSLADGTGGTTAVDPGPVTLEAGDSAGALGSWNGTDYMHTNTGTKIVNEARVYTNKGADETASFADAGYIVFDGTTDATNINGYVTLTETDTPTLGRIMADAFTHSGTQDHSYDSTTDAAFTTRGTYDGAPGLYRCAGTDCSSTNDGEGSPSALGGQWHFKPDAGAMVSQPDEHYLYYGWWVSKDSDGAPTAASAFAGRFGTDSGDSADGLNDAGDLTRADLTGSASYSGHAAGKFAMSNPLTATGDGGHFTADAELNATFSGTDSGVTGTIDNFRLNDGSNDPGWSVSLNNGGLGTTGGSITAPTGDDALGTVWSINGNEAPASGTWSGTMYDEAVGDDADDGSNIPTTVTGTFYSEFSTIGRMVGAFGANKE